MNSSRGNAIVQAGATQKGTLSVGYFQKSRNK